MHQKKVWKIVSIIIGIVVLLLAGFAVWFYATPPSKAKETFAKVLPLPVATVGGRPIYYKDMNARIASAEALSKATGETVDQSTVRSQILDQLIDEKKMQLLASRHGISVSSSELTEALEAIKKQANEQSPNGFGALLGQYNLSEAQFQEEVLKPQLLYTDMTIWFNGQKDLNQKQYDIADQIQSTFTEASSSTSTFASLVAQYSEDDNSKQEEGDLGYVNINEVLPEFKTPLDAAKTGDIEIVPSRYGIHVFWVVDKDSKGTGDGPRVKLSQIFLTPEDFSDWYDQQTKQYQVKKFMD